MVAIKKSLLVSGVLIYIIVTLLLRTLSLFIIPSGRFRIISAWTRAFSRFLRRLLKIKVNIEGNRSCLNENGNFIISNHLGYLDGVVLGSLFAVTHTSKSEVKRWPLFGWMTQVSGTIFIDRKARLKSAGYIQEVASMLQRRVNILVFPEGTSTNGERLLPFQTIHFQAPLDSKSPILPVTVTYEKIGGEEVNIQNRDKVCWYGQVKFYEHLLDVLRLEGIEARVVIHPKVDSESFLEKGLSRKEISEKIHGIISRDYPLFR